MWHLNGKLIKAKEITIGDTQYPKQIFSKWSESELNAIGIYSINDVRAGTLAEDNTQTWSEPVIDYVANTRTYSVEDIPVEKLNKEKAKGLDRDIRQVKEYANKDITDSMASWKQRNMITEGVLEMTALCIEKGLFTQAEVDARPKAAALLEAWGGVVTRRGLSDKHEADLKSGTKDLKTITEELYPEPEPKV